MSCRLRLEDGRKGLVEIGRHLAEIAAPVRLRRQPQRDADLVDFGQGLGEFRASRRQLRLPLVVHLTRHIVPGDELPRPIEFNLRQRQCGLALVDSGDPRVQQSDLAVDVLHGALQVPAPAPCLRFDRARRRGGCLQVCFRGVDRCLLLGDRNPVRLLVQLGEEISLAHTVVVIHQNAGDLSCHAGRNKRHVPIHECVVRGDGVEHLLDPRDAEHEENCQDSNAEHTGQKLSLPRGLSGLLRRGAGLRRCLRGFRVVGSRSISIRCRLRIDRIWLVALLGHRGCLALPKRHSGSRLVSWFAPRQEGQQVVSQHSMWAAGNPRHYTKVSLGPVFPCYLSYIAASSHSTEMWHPQAIGKENEHADHRYASLYEDSSHPRIWRDPRRRVWHADPGSSRDETSDEDRIGSGISTSRLRGTISQ